MTNELTAGIASDSDVKDAGFDIELPIELAADRKASLIFVAVGVVGALFFLVWMLNPEMIQLPQMDPKEGRERGLRNLYRGLSENKSIALPFMFTLSVYTILHNAVRYFRPARVYIDDIGVEITRLRGQKTYPWSAVGPATVTKRFDTGHRTRTVGFNNLNSPVPGLVKFPEEFDLEPEALVMLIEAARSKADKSASWNAGDAVPVLAADMQTDSNTDMADTPTPAQSDWQPPAPEGYAIRDERPPYGRYAFYLLLLGIVAAGGIWLASQVVISDAPEGEPLIDIAQGETVDPEAPPMGADEAAWVRALEKDTLEGYREYLAEFPDGKFADKAQEQIDAYDNRAWATAEQRNTIAGYEDYLESWEDGLHADKARERIAEMKAARDAAAADAAERAARERADWERAARENTVASYQTYLSSHPTGPNADEARSRIAALQASAADTAAWQAADAAKTADAYQQYLTSFPQGAYVPQAIAALERLRPSVGREFKDCDACPTMTVLPAGNDTLGAPDSDGKARPNEKPARPVSFGSPFAIGVSEVTFAEYDACVAAGGCASRPSDNGWGRGSRPVINVDFADAQAYTQWLSSTTGFTYSLPTEAQWEYAARAGANDVYPGGSLAALCAFANGASNETSVAWVNQACTDPGVGRTLPVGSLSANGFGLRDVVGNVAEWTLDCNTLNLRDAPVDGSADARGSCGQRAVRGGSWFNGPDDLRYTARMMLRRGDSNDFTGFRVVRKLGD